jgi:hypothetical protein|tara:strand:+ start:65897 stop:67234 length:1338 start_codon:yes stop_codon:yes gene_type:complete
MSVFHKNAPKRNMAPTHSKQPSIRSKLRSVLCAALFLLTSSFLIITPTKQAQARCCYCCIEPLQQVMHVALVGIVIAAQKAEFKTLRDELLSKTWWHSGVAPLAKSATMELVANGWSLVGSFGAMLDAKLLSETIIDMQILSAKSAKRHMPSVPMCKFASLNKSMRQADQRSKMVSAVLGEFSLRRVLGQAESIGASETKDTASRVKAALERHCDNKEFGGEMSFVCPAGINNAGDTTKDINFTNAVDVPDTINIGLDPAIANINTDNEIANVMAMKTMLYNHEAAPRIGKTDLQNNYDGNQSRYLKWRSTVAKRTVAENSFDALIGMKAASGLAVQNQFKAQLDSLGMPAADIDATTKIAPSYWAQMEHLTKTVYQNTNFFVNLYDNPNNVLRQSASMDAISLMQMRDYYNSLIRSEMALSVLLDTEVGNNMDALNNTLNQWGN